MSSFLLGAPSTLEQGLLHSWSLEGNSNDALGTGNGTDTAVTYTTPKLGSACAAFNGVSSKITTTSMSKPLIWSMSCWMNPRYSTSSTSEAAWFIGAYGSATCAYLIRANGSTTSWNLSNAVINLNGFFTLPNNTWSLVTVTYDGTNARGYLNGTLVSGPLAMPCSASTAVTGLGWHTASGYYYGGLTDDAVMWDKELSQAEVTTLYNSGNGLETMSGTLLTGLIHQWHLNGNSTDNVGSANGTDTAITYGGKLGQCAMFNGTTSRIQTAIDGPTGAAARSISMWLYHSVDSTDGCIFMGTGSGTALSILHYASTGALVINDTLTTHCSNTMTLNSWHHVVFTYSGTVGKLYVDGGTPTTETWTLNTAAGVIVLGNFYASANLWQGLIDEVGMWNRAITQAEVAYLYANGSPGRCPW